MKTGYHCLRVVSIRVVLVAGTLLLASVCSTAIGKATPFVYTTDTTFNLTDATKATLLITADAFEVRAQVKYLRAKSTLNGQLSIAPDTDIPQIYIPPGQTRTFNIDLDNPAFAGGFGAVSVRSVTDAGDPSPVPFIAYLRENNDETLSAVSGKHLIGNTFRIPTISAQSQRLRVVVTLASGSGSGGAAMVDIRETRPNGYQSEFAIPIGATFRWDSEQLGRRMQDGSIEIFSFIPLTVSYYYEQTGPLGVVRKYHVHMPACAPV